MAIAIAATAIAPGMVVIVTVPGMAVVIATVVGIVTVIETVVLTDETVIVTRTVDVIALASMAAIATPHRRRVTVRSRRARRRVTPPVTHRERHRAKDNVSTSRASATRNARRSARLSVSVSANASASNRPPRTPTPPLLPPFPATTPQRARTTFRPIQTRAMARRRTGRVAKDVAGVDAVVDVAAEAAIVTMERRTIPAATRIRVRTSQEPAKLPMKSASFTRR